MLVLYGNIVVFCFGIDYYDIVVVIFVFFYIIFKGVFIFFFVDINFVVIIIRIVYGFFYMGGSLSLYYDFYLLGIEFVFFKVLVFSYFFVIYVVLFNIGVCSLIFLVLWFEYFFINNLFKNVVVVVDVVF